MTYPSLVVTTVICFAACVCCGQDPSISDQYLRVANDYRLIADGITQPDLQKAAARLARDGYRAVVRNAEVVQNKSEDDWFALGQCHEALGNDENAVAAYQASMSDGETMRGLLSLSRMAAATKPDEAESYFKKAIALRPQDPRLGPFHLLIGSAYQRERNWGKAIEHIEVYLEYVLALLEEDSSSINLIAKSEATKIRLNDLAIYQELEGKPAPDWLVREPIQGDPIPLSELRGKIVLMDFFATWAAPSRQRMEEIKKLVADYPAIKVLGLAIPIDDGIPGGHEADLQAAQKYAQSADIQWMLAYTERVIAEKYGVSTVPHTVVIDQNGNVRLIVQANTEKNLTDLRNLIAELVK